MDFFTFSADALDDLRDIWDWIAADSEQAANKLQQDIIAACNQVGQHHELGARRPGWTSRALRFLLVRSNYWIVYDPERQPVEILRVLHAARDIPKILTTDK